MHAGDTIDIHFHVVSQQEGWHIDVTDMTTGGSGTIVLNSAGRATPAGVRQAGDRQLARLGPRRRHPELVRVGDRPHVAVLAPGLPVLHSWEIRSASPSTSRPGLETSPIQIKSVTFGDGSHPTQWATVSDTGGKAEILGNSFVGPTDCTGYGGPFCTYPFFTQGSSGVHYGTNFPNEINDLGGVDQFAQTLECDGPFGPNSTYCDTLVPIVLP